MTAALATQTLVLVPGLLNDRGLWEAQIAALGDAVGRIVVADVASDDSLGGMADRLLGSVEGDFALAGLSMGGYVVQEVMRRAPERVTRLALLDTNARADTDEQVERRRAQMARAEGGDFESIPGELLPMLVHPDRLEDAAFVEHARAMAFRVGPEAFVRQQTAILNRRDGRDDLARITVPTLCLCGRDDGLTPPKVHAEMVERLPRGHMVVIERCGHLATLEQPVAVSAVMRYWLSVE